LNDITKKTTIDIDGERLTLMRECVNQQSWTQEDAEAAAAVATNNPRVLPLAQAIAEKAAQPRLYVVK
jgi:hypothetical protein